MNRAYLMAAPALATVAVVEAAEPKDLSKYKEESVSGGSLLLAAYLVMWALVAVFVGKTVLRQATTEARVKELSELLEARGD